MLVDRHNLLIATLCSMNPFLLPYKTLIHVAARSAGVERKVVGLFSFLFSFFPYFMYICCSYSLCSLNLFLQMLFLVLPYITCRYKPGKVFFALFQVKMLNNCYAIIVAFVIHIQTVNDLFV